MAKREKQVEVAIPDGVSVEVDRGVFTVRGDNGEVTKDLFHPRIKARVDDDTVVFEATKQTQNEKKLMHTFRSHLKNLYRGVTDGITYKLQICASHFPMNVDYNDGTLEVKNYLGERVPRTLDIKDGVDCTVDGEEIVLKGVDKELVGQTAADIEKLTRRSGFDRRVFQDGIYITVKDGNPV
jgi:large subunit ribosomal protein L6